MPLRLLPKRFPLGFLPELCQTMLMTQKLRRRDFLKVAAISSAFPVAWNSVSAAAGAATGRPAPAASAAEDTSGLTAYQLGPQIWIRYDNRLLTCYRAHRSQKYPYLFPLTGPLSGLSLTDETTLPYPHHRSLFLGCDRVNRGNYWQEGYDTGQILSSGPKLGAETKERVVITDACEWQKPGGPVVLTDARTITVTCPSPKLRFLNWEITLKATEPITVEKTNHSFFSMRASLDISPKGGGYLVNAEGLKGEKATAGVKSAWCDFYGRRAAMPDIVEGIAIFDHPRNPWAPTLWFTRDYGFASPTPLNFIEKPWTIEADKTVTFRYAVVLHAGDPSSAGLASLFEEWAAKPA